MAQDDKEKDDKASKVVSKILGKRSVATLKDKSDKEKSDEEELSVKKKKKKGAIKRRMKSS